ncbi:MAG: hypothetical protein AB8F94_01790 [Saprospiraceae bacterium]
MMKKFKYFLFFAFWLSLNSCQDDDLSKCIITEPDCLTKSGEPVINFDSIVDFTQCIHSHDFVPLHRYEYINPVFNPSNTNEIIYLRNEYSETGGYLKKELLKYNFCSNETSYITDLALYGIDWSSKDWIIYTGYDQNLYKVKSNGDSLTQLTTNGQFNGHAKWNDSGTQYLYRQEGIGGLLIAEERGGILDTLDGLLVSQWSWDNDRIFFTGGTFDNRSRIGEYDLINKEMIVIDSTLTRILGAIKYNESVNELVFLFGNQVFAFHNLMTNQVDQRIIGYDNRTYNSFDLSSDGKTIVCSRSNLTQVDACTIEVERFLHLIDISGDNERVLSIPE